jgi:hypothetical protein
MNALKTADLHHLGDATVREPLLSALIAEGITPAHGEALCAWGQEQDLDAWAQEDLAGFLAVVSVVGWSIDREDVVTKFGVQAAARGSNLGSLVIGAFAAGVPFSDFAALLQKASA